MAGSFPGRAGRGVLGAELAGWVEEGGVGPGGTCGALERTLTITVGCVLQPISDKPRDHMNVVRGRTQVLENIDRNKHDAGG